MSRKLVNNYSAGSVERILEIQRDTTQKVDSIVSSEGVIDDPSAGLGSFVYGEHELTLSVIGRVMERLDSADDTGRLAASFALGIEMLVRMQAETVSQAD